MKNRTVVAVIAAVGVAVALRTFAGQAPQSGKQERPLRHDAAAIVKLVPVRVLGSDGRPVTGLRKEDFVLYEDGQRKTITEFEVHAVTDAGMTVTPGPPPATEPAVRASGAMGRKIFIFLDQQASDRAGKDKANTAALHFLETQVRPGDLVGVLGFYAMSGFYIREYLTSDMKRIRRAIEGPTETRPSPGEAVGLPPDDVEGGLEPTTVPQNLRAALAGKEASVNEGPVGGAGEGAVFVPGTAAFQRVDFVPRLADVAEVFKLIPGNKSLILFTARNMGSEAARIGQLFGAAGTAVYAINTQDWDMGPFATKFKKIWWDHSLKDLSTASGGKYFADINEAATIAQDLQSLTGNFYVLGYYVRESWGGKYHKIRVEVARSGARVLVQDGYADPKPFSEMSDFERDVQLIDLAWADRPTSGFQPLAVDPLIVLEDDGARACLLTRLEVNAKGGAPPVRNEIIAFLKNDAGASKLSRRWVVDLSKYDGRSLCAHLSVPVSAGGWEFRVVVRDLVNGEACLGRAEFKVPEAATEPGPRLSSPLIFEEGTGTAYVRLPTAKPSDKKGKPTAEPSLIELYRLIPKDGRLVIGEISPGAKKLTVVLPFEIRPSQADETPMLSVQAKFVLKPGGGEIPLKLIVREHRTFQGKPDILIADIPLPAVAPGEYDLVISVEDVGMERRAEIAKPLIVR